MAVIFFFQKYSNVWPNNKPNYKQAPYLILIELQPGATSPPFFIYCHRNVTEPNGKMAIDLPLPVHEWQRELVILFLTFMNYISGSV